MKKFFCTAVVAALSIAASAAENDGLVFQEDFETVRTNAKGITSVVGWYSPIGLKEDCEVSVIREKQDVCSGKYSWKLSNMSEKNLIYMKNWFFP